MDVSRISAEISQNNKIVEMTSDKLNQLFEGQIKTYEKIELQKQSVMEYILTKQQEVDKIV